MTNTNNMKDYKLTKMYMLISPSTHLVYIGHTIQRLSQRHYGHKQASNQCSSKEIIAFGDSKIILIENYECETEEEARRREQEIIDGYGEKCVNCHRAYRSDEYTKEYHKEYNKVYGEERKEEIKAYAAKYREENKEVIKAYREENKEALKAYAVKYREEHKDAINQRRRELRTIRKSKQA